MAKFLLPKQGVPALAHLSSPSASQWPSHLIVKHAEAFKQATVYLQFPLSPGSNDSITLVYDADNLLCDETSLTHANTSLSGDQLKHIARDGTPELMRLCLSLRSLCPISCPTGLPRAQIDEPLVQQLLELASAKKVEVLFDFKWVHQEHRGTFRQIIRCPQDLSGVPADLRTLYQPGQWLAAFRHAEHADSEALPSFSIAAKKRRIQAGTSDPPRKRISKNCALISSPSPSATHLASSDAVDAMPEDPPLYETIYSWQSKARSAFAPLSPSNNVQPSAALNIPGSPTEKATSEATSSPKPSSLVTGAFDLNETISNVVRNLLPQALRDSLPKELAKLLSAPTKLPSAPQLDLNGFIRAQAGYFMQKFHDEAHDQVERLRSTAVEEFDELLEEKKADIDIAHEENMTGLDTVFAEKVAESKDRAEAIADEVHDRAYSRFSESLRCLMQEEAARRFERRALEFGRRAVSLPP